MSETSSTPRKTRWGRRILLLGILAFLLENIPGTYVIDDAQDEFDLDSYEGIGLLAVEGAKVNADLYFEGPTLHRVSRHAEIRVPADTRLTVSASMIPLVEEGEVVARPHHGEIRSNRPLTFIYRGVTVARANRLRMRENAGERQLEAVGRYRLLTALATVHRYHRQKEIKRDYQPPTTAGMDFTAEFHPDHELDFGQGLKLRTGAVPGTLRLTDARFERGKWIGGELDLNLHIGDPQELANDLLENLLPDPIDLGGAFEVNLDRVYNIAFSENHLDLKVDGRIRPSNSETLGDMFHPGFSTRIGVAFDLPRNQLLRESTARVWLKNIHSLDFNRSNPVIDKLLRSVLRSKRDEAEADFDFGEDLKELQDLPVEIFVHECRIDGAAGGGPVLRMRVEVLEKGSAGGG